MEYLFKDYYVHHMIQQKPYKELLPEYYADYSVLSRGKMPASPDPSG
jgi:hypothetical protein